MAEQSSRAVQIDQLHERGYVLVPRFVPADELRKLNEVARVQLAARVSRSSSRRISISRRTALTRGRGRRDGAATARRYGPGAVFAQCATAPACAIGCGSTSVKGADVTRTSQLPDDQASALWEHDGWHRDIRYWSFEREDLVSVWMAIGEETIDNGALWFVPGSHAMAFGRRGSMTRNSFGSTARRTPKSCARPSRRGSRRGCRLLPLQCAALGRQESQRCRKVFARLHLSRPKQSAGAGNPVGIETRNSAEPAPNE